MAYIKRPKKKDRRIADFRRKERHSIYNTTMWISLREWKRKKDPLCERCLGKGVVTAGEHVHHIKSFMEASDLIERERLAYDPDNLMTVCLCCHNELHKK